MVNFNCMLYCSHKYILHRYSVFSLKHLLSTRQICVAFSWILQLWYLKDMIPRLIDNIPAISSKDEHILYWNMLSEHFFSQKLEFTLQSWAYCQRTYNRDNREIYTRLTHSFESYKNSLRNLQFCSQQLKCSLSVLKLWSLFCTEYPYSRRFVNKINSRLHFVNILPCMDSDIRRCSVLRAQYKNPTLY